MITDITKKWNICKGLLVNLRANGGGKNSALEFILVTETKQLNARERSAFIYTPHACRSM